MDFYEVVHKRRAIRKYKPDPVPREVLLRILDAANWAPSGINLQQWEFIMVTGNKKKELGESYGKAAELFSRDWEEKRRQMFIEFARDYGGAPVVIVALTEATDNPVDRKMHLESVSAAFQNLLLAACAEGLGTCWMTGPLQDEEAIRRILDISPEKEIVALTPIGYADMIAKPPPRKDPDLTVKVRWVE